MKHLNQKMLYVVCAAVCLIINSGIDAKAQETVRGKVYDTDKSTPLPGALVSALNGVVHSTSGTDGTFEIKVPEGEQVTVQFMGYAPQAFKVGKTRWYDIVLQPDNERLDEVVVTALGMKREKGLLVMQPQNCLLIRLMKLAVATGLTGFRARLPESSSITHHPDLLDR